MSKTYRFECVDTDDETGETTTTIVEVNNSDCETWSGYNGPMYKFYDFLRGCGFIFGVNTQIGVMTDEGEFSPAGDY
jgi:hypothetical protein